MVIDKGCGICTTCQQHALLFTAQDRNAGEPSPSLLHTIQEQHFNFTCAIPCFLSTEFLRKLNICKPTQSRETLCNQIMHPVLGFTLLQTSCIRQAGTVNIQYATGMWRPATWPELIKIVSNFSHAHKIQYILRPSVCFFPKESFFKK